MFWPHDNGDFIIEEKLAARSLRQRLAQRPHEQIHFAMHEHCKEGREKTVDDTKVDVRILRADPKDGVRDEANAGQRQATQNNLSILVAQIQPDLVAGLIEFPEHQLDGNDKLLPDFGCAKFVAPPLE